MPLKPPHFCLKCGKLVRGACEGCDGQRRAEVDRRRGSAASRGYGRRWAKAAKVFLSLHPMCVHCLAENRAVPATMVDHRIPHKGDDGLFWDQENWQSLCAHCHSVKTAGEDGGFGNMARCESSVTPGMTGASVHRG